MNCSDVVCGMTGGGNATVCCMAGSGNDIVCGDVGSGYSIPCSTGLALRPNGFTK